MVESQLDRFILLSREWAGISFQLQIPLPAPSHSLQIFTFRNIAMKRAYK